MAGKLAEQGKAIFSRLSKPELLDRLNLPTEKKSKDAKMWTPEEDLLLRSAVERHGESDWDSIVAEIPGRNKLQCTQRWRKTLKPGQKKGPWAPEEDAMLLRVMKTEQPGDWQAVARKVSGRNAKQCKERWTLNLDPDINHGPWSAEEDDQLVALHAEIGGKWALLAKKLPGRTEHSIKTRFLSLERQAARIRGWSIAEDRLVLKYFMQSPYLDGTTTVMKHLSGRSKKQVNQRWAYLKEKYVSITDLVEYNPQGKVELRDQDLVYLIPDIAAESAQLLSEALDFGSVETLSKKAAPRLHPSSTLSQPSGHDKKKNRPMSRSSSSMASIKADTGLSLMNSAYPSSCLEPLPSLEGLEEALNPHLSYGHSSASSQGKRLANTRSLNFDSTIFAESESSNHKAPAASASSQQDSSKAFAQGLLPFPSSGQGGMPHNTPVPTMDATGTHFPHEAGGGSTARPHLPPRWLEESFHRSKTLGSGAARTSYNSLDESFLTLLEESSKANSLRTEVALPHGLSSFQSEGAEAKLLRTFASSVGLEVDTPDFEDLVSNLQIGEN